MPFARPTPRPTSAAAALPLVLLLVATHVAGQQPHQLGHSSRQLQSGSDDSSAPCIDRSTFMLVDFSTASLVRSNLGGQGGRGVGRARGMRTCLWGRATASCDKCARQTHSWESMELV